MTLSLVQFQPKNRPQTTTKSPINNNKIAHQTTRKIAHQQEKLHHTRLFLLWV
jgi:hypothetical protein